MRQSNCGGILWLNTLNLNMGLPRGQCAVLPFHPWLCGHAQLHHQVCWWHDGGRPDHQWQCGARSTISPSTSVRPSSWLWTTGNGGGCTPPSTLMGQELQVPQCPHHWGFNVALSHQHSCEEGGWNDLAWPLRSLRTLQLHHQEHPDRLYHCLLWQLHRPRPEGPTASGEDSPAYH
jgi:hypothetical protein